MIDKFISYLQYEKRSGQHTITSYRTDLGQFHAFLKGHLGQTEPDLMAVNRNDVRAWLVSLMNTDIKSVSVNRKLACLKSFYKFLEKEGLVEISPAETVKALKGGKPLPAFLKESEINDLFDAVPFGEDEHGLAENLMLELLYGTGIRLSELIGLKFNDINFDNKTLKVLGKRNKERIVPINARLFEKLKTFSHISQRNEGFLLLTTKGKQLYPMFVYRVVNGALSKICSLTQKSPHVLRHTFATHLLNMGADLNSIKKLLGHSSLAATQIYTHNSFEKIKNAFNKAHPKA